MRLTVLSPLASTIPHPREMNLTTQRDDSQTLCGKVTGNNYPRSIGSLSLCLTCCYRCSRGRECAYAGKKQVLCRNSQSSSTILPYATLSFRVLVYFIQISRSRLLFTFGRFFSWPAARQAGKRRNGSECGHPPFLKPCAVAPIRSDNMA